MSTEEPKETAATVENAQPVTEEVIKRVKEKKSRSPREKKPKTTSHPPYFQMIREALMALKEKSGSSPYAIAKYMEEKHKAVLPANFKKMLGLQLKNAAARGKLIKIKASYKLSEETANKAGEEKKNKNKNKKARTVSSRKTRSAKKKKESEAKKIGEKKAKKSNGGNKPKQPKSIKSTAAKRTRKTAAVVASAS